MTTPDALTLRTNLHLASPREAARLAQHLGAGTTLLVKPRPGAARPDAIGVFLPAAALGGGAVSDVYLGTLAPDVAESLTPHLAAQAETRAAVESGAGRTQLRIRIEAALPARPATAPRRRSASPADVWI